MKILNILFYGLLALIVGGIIFFLVTNRHPFDTDFWAKVSENVWIGILCILPFLIVIGIGLYHWIKSITAKK